MTRKKKNKRPTDAQKSLERTGQPPRKTLVDITRKPGPEVVYLRRLDAREKRHTADPEEVQAAVESRMVD